MPRPAYLGLLLALLVMLLLLLLQHLLGVVLLGLGLFGFLDFTSSTLFEYIRMAQEALSQRSGHHASLARRERQARAVNAVFERVVSAGVGHCNVLGCGHVVSLLVMSLRGAGHEARPTLLLAP